MGQAVKQGLSKLAGIPEHHVNVKRANQNWPHKATNCDVAHSDRTVTIYRQFSVDAKSP
jgi:hypothetical protein